MNKKTFALVVMWLWAGWQFATAQNADSTILNRIQDISSDMFRDPLTAKDEFLKLKKDFPNASELNKGRICQNLATTYGMTNNLDSAFYFANEALQHFPDTSWDKASLLKMIAILHRIKGNYQDAEIALKKSLALNESNSREPVLMAATLQEYGALCLDQHFYFKATTLFLKALDIVSAPEVIGKDGRFTAVKLRANLAEAYLASGNYPFAIREFTKALPELAVFKDDEGLLRGGVQLADAFILNGNYDSADSLLDQLMPIAIKLQNDELRSYVLLKQGDSKTARGLFKKALPLHRNSFELLNALNSPALLECVNSYLITLGKTGNSGEAKNIMSLPNVKSAVADGQPAYRLKYKKTEIGFLEADLSPEKISAYYQELLLLTDSVNKQERLQSAAEIQARYQFERQQEDERLLQRENDLLKQKADFKRRQLFFFIAISLLIIVILIMTLVRFRQRALIESEKLKTNQRELAFQKDRSDWMEREKSFRDQLINQQKIVLTQAIADKEEMDLRLKELVKEKQEERRKELLEQLEKSKDKKLNIEILLAEFNAIQPTFTSQLLKKYPELSGADIQFCTLIRMNLTTKEISVLLNIEPQSIYKKKYRAIEKMGLSEVEDFEKVLFGIG
jgi:tetratricopeptide (TPR) repeat protein